MPRKDDEKPTRWADIEAVLTAQATRVHEMHQAAVTKPWLEIPVRLQIFGGWLQGPALVLNGLPEFEGLLVVTTRAVLDELLRHPPEGAFGPFKDDQEAAQYVAYEEFARRSQPAADDLLRWRTVMAVEARVRRDA